MIEFDAVNGRRVQVRSSAQADAPHGLAKLIPAGMAGGLSSEVVGLAYGPAERIRTYVEVSQLRELERQRIGSGTAVLYAVPSETIAQSGLPAETRIGMLEVGSTIAHGYLYRPINRMSDLISQFEALALREGLHGVVVPGDRFQVTQESYATTVPDVGLVTIERPRGVPAAGRRVAGGAMWVDRVPDRTPSVVYEDRAVRLSFRPAVRRAADGTTSRPAAGAAAQERMTPEFEQAVVRFTRGLTTTTWS